MLVYKIRLVIFQFLFFHTKFVDSDLLVFITRQQGSRRGNAVCSGYPGKHCASKQIALLAGNVAPCAPSNPFSQLPV